MKPLPFQLPAVLCPEESGCGGEQAPPIQRPDILLYPLLDEWDQPAENWIEAYRRQIGGSCGTVLADCGMTVCQQRAALIACNESPQCPPFLACLALDGEGMTPDGWEGAAALILLQSMGCAGVLFAPADDEAEDELPRLFSALWEDARIPVGVALPERADRQQVASFPRASLLMAPRWEDSLILREHCLATGFYQRPVEIAPPPEDDCFIAVANGRSFMLENTFDIDGELECTTDFAEELLEREKDGWGALRLLLPDEDALAVFAAEQYMIKLPVSIGTDDPALMEKALRAFCGRGMADGTCELEACILAPLVQKYGLIVL